MAFFNRIPGADRYSAGENAAAEGTVQQEMNRARRNGRRDIIFCIIIVIVALFIQESRDTRSVFVRLSESETEFSVTGMNGDKHVVKFASVVSVELRDDMKTFDRGEAVSAEEGKKYTSGTFRNEAFGEYELHVANKLKEGIVMRMPDSTLVFNYESDETTEALYNYILEQLP